MRDHVAGAGKGGVVRVARAVVGGAALVGVQSSSFLFVSGFGLNQVSKPAMEKL